MTLALSSMRRAAEFAYVFISTACAFFKDVNNDWLMNSGKDIDGGNAVYLYIYIGRL